MNEDTLKLTTYFGERDRAGGRFLAEALLDLYERHGLQTSVLLRGTEGFGMKHRLHTDRLLTLSDDLPIVSVAVDARERIERVVPEVAEVSGEGLITLERARVLTGGPMGAVELPEGSTDATKLTVYCGRRDRAGGRPAFREVVRHLHACGVAGATVLLGVDGTGEGRRRRARLLGHNAGVPMMVVSVGEREAMARALPGLADMLDRPRMTLERVRVCKRDGRRLADLPRLSETDGGGLNLWQKLTVFVGQQARHEARPLYISLIERLRGEAASGATALRGIWGYHGDHAPHGDRVLALRRRVPIMIVVIDRPSRARRWFEIIDELTQETGLVTSEIVPAFQARGPLPSGGLRLAVT